MGYSEAGRLGAIKANIVRKGVNQRKYELNPKICKKCGIPIPYEKRRNNFCSSSCAASLNNIGIRRHGEPRVGRSVRRLRFQRQFRTISVKTFPCEHCGADCKFSSAKMNKFCNARCQQNFAWEKRKKGFLATGSWVGINNESSLSRNFKKLLKETSGTSCTICKNAEWLGQSIPLILDHIDGHSSNWSLENLRLICGNCDMLLPTYKSRNRGNGRAWRRARYAAGMSY